jgi:hypothetical protein
MRTPSLLLAGWLVVSSVVFAQAPADSQSASPPSRYGITAATDFYPQADAKQALASVVKAIQNKRYEYLAAHLLDPEFVDAKVAERAAKYDAEAEKMISAKRAEQLRNPSSSGGVDIIPTTPAEFAQRVKQEATKLAFDSLIRSMSENLAESPENSQLLAKFLRDGMPTEAGAGATFTLKDLPNKQVYLKKVNDRWYLEDKQQDDGKVKADK